MRKTVISSAPPLVAGLCSLLLFVSGCATLSGTTEPPGFSIVAIEPLQVAPLEQTYRLKVRLQNPNDHALDISGMSYTLEVNGEPLLRGVSNEAVSLTAYGESIIELTGVSTLVGFVRQIRALQEGNSGTASYRLSGRLSLSNRLGSLPFSYEGALLPPPAER